MNTLILGGARSGKSQFAQEFAIKTGERVLFVATAEAGDAEMCRRIEEHKKKRPSAWRTLEAASDIADQIEQAMGDARVVIVDCITLLVSNIICRFTGKTQEQTEEELLEEKVSIEINGLVTSLKMSDASFIIVSNEVGLGLVPDNKMSRLYRDLLGKANQVLAQNVDEVYLMVAGLPVKIKPSA